MIRAMFTTTTRARVAFAALCAPLALVAAAVLLANGTPDTPAGCRAAVLAAVAATPTGTDAVPLTQQGDVKAACDGLDDAIVQAALTDALTDTLGGDTAP